MQRPAVQFQRVVILARFRAGAERDATRMRHNQAEIIGAQNKIGAVAFDNVG